MNNWSSNNIGEMIYALEKKLQKKGGLNGQGFLIRKLFKV